MSVLIKGMKMPHDCDECRLCAFIPVGDYGINRKCLPLNAKAEITIRRVDCSLVELPPHGRLIDADALMENAQYKGTYDMVTAWDIVAAQTIVPAEKSNTDSFIRIIEEDGEEDGMDSFIRILKD